MRRAWSAGVTHSGKFFLPHEVFELELVQGAQLVYIYLVCRKSQRHSADNLSCSVISKAVGLCEKTVHTHLRALAGAGLIQVESYGREFSYALCPIWDKVRKSRNTMSLTRSISWMLTKQKWLTGEVFDALFPLPNDVFQLGLKGGDLLVYIYLQYQKGVRSGQCWPSYSTIGAAVGMSRKTVRKHVCALVDKGLMQTENTTVRWEDGHVYNGNLLYTLTPIQQVMKEREDELLAGLKLAAAQRKWDQKVAAMAPGLNVPSGKNYSAVISKGTPGAGARIGPVCGGSGSP